MTHELKCWMDSFEAIGDGRKTHEVRRNDRQFETGDRLHLREWRGDSGDGGGIYTGREIFVEVTYVTKGGTFGLPSDVDVLSVRRV